MSVIEHRIEAEGLQPDYSGITFTPEEIAAGEHRKFVGGVWDTHGLRQLDYLKLQGLQPHHTVLDVGCGCFRAGRHIVDYLEPAHYYGVDANHSLIQAGYDVELTDAQRSRLPITNLRANDRFDVSFGTQIDYAMAQSVFTHVSLNHIRLCLYRVAKVMKPGGSFYATFFERPKSTPIDYIGPSKRGKPFFTEKNVFSYYREDLAWAAQFGPWDFRYIGDWGHPAKQKMVQYVRLSEKEVARRAAAAAAASAASPVYDDLKKFVRRGRKWAARKIDPR